MLMEEEEEEDEEDENGDLEKNGEGLHANDGSGVTGGSGAPSATKTRRRKGTRRRFQEFSKAYHRLVDTADEMKRRQRLKWRQSAMHLTGDEDDNDYNGDTTGDGLTGANNANTTTLSSMDNNANNNQTLIIPPSEELFQRTSTPPSIIAPHSSMDISMDTPIPSESSMPTPTPPQPPSLSSLLSQPSNNYRTANNNHPQYLNNNSNNNINNNTINNHNHTDPGEDIAWQVHVFKCIQAKTQRSVEKSETGKISGVWDNAIATLRDYFLLGSVSDNLSLMPSYLVMRGKSLKSSLLVVAQWREQRDLYRYGNLVAGSGGGGADAGGNMESFQKQWFGGFCGESRPQSDPATTNTTNENKAPFKNTFSLFLNILACFFYMMNYYIVEPSSTRYANALGMNDAMSGLIIGAMPWAAIFSAVMYSIWSNKCYRSPLICSGVLLVCGNVLYATAYRYESIQMALCGRFLTGLGGQRSLNRRYIADTTPLAHRTAVNAAFGTATAMGAALGPATAIMLDGVVFEFHVPLYGMVHFNVMTGPGFVMSILWTIFTFILVFTFDEPERSGLEEQRQKELADASEMLTPANSPMNLAGRSEYEMANFNEASVNKRTASSVEAQEYIYQVENEVPDANNSDSLWSQMKFIWKNITAPVRICMFLLFSKMFTVESVISAASMMTKNRYGWAVQQVGALGTVVGCLTIPISIFIGFISQYREDRVLMIWLMSFAALGMGLLVDFSDLVSAETITYNENNPFAVGPYQYIAGYLLFFCSVQAFDGVVGSVLSKVIPTALATGTINSGLLATLVGTVSLLLRKHLNFCFVCLPPFVSSLLILLFSSPRISQYILSLGEHVATCS